MFGINDALRERESQKGPIRVAIIGAGTMGGYMVHQLMTAKGMNPDIVIDVNVERARSALTKAGIAESVLKFCHTPAEVATTIKEGKYAYSGLAELAWTTPEIDVVVEATGNPFVYAHIAFNSIFKKKHLVSFNVEGDVVIGHILKMFADNAGVVYTGVHGDEPGVVKALYDEADALGFEILAAGRHDYGGGDIKWNKNNANEYLKRFKAASVQGNLALFASFIDGSKTNEECAMIANATGLSPDVRGMHGPEVSFAEFPTRVPQLLDAKKNGGILHQTGVVERILPAEGPDAQPVWCFVVVRVVNELQRVFMSDMAGMGNLAGSLNPGTGGMTKAQLLDDGSGGPAQAGIFYTPYHYVAIQAPISIAQAVIYNRPTIAPIGRKRFADVMALTKEDLKTGDIIDEIGGECVAGRVDKARVVRDGGYLPFGLAWGARVLRNINAGEYLRWDDVALRDDRALIVQLRRLQDTLFEVA